MAVKRNGSKKNARRTFLKQVTVGGALGATLGGFGSAEGTAKAGRARTRQGEIPSDLLTSRIQFPRVFTGPNLKEIAFPLGGIGTGSISLGGRGELRDWEIFNRPDKGNLPKYVFPSIWAQVKGREPVARVLELQIKPPYVSVDGWGLGMTNVPGLTRLEDATFTGAFPFAWLDFHDDKLPVQVSLEAFNPMVPLDVDASGLPVAILRYKIKNPGGAPAKVGVCYSLESPVGTEGRQATFREDTGVSGIYMDNPFLPATDPLKGSMALCVLGAPAGSVSYLRNWKRGTWWDGPLTFWDDFTADGALDSSAPGVMPVSSLAVTQTIPAGGDAQVTFMLAWHFPNRTPERCGWRAPDDSRKTVNVGNYYTQRFKDAWDVSRHVVGWPTHLLG